MRRPDSLKAFVFVALALLASASAPAFAQKAPRSTDQVVEAVRTIYASTNEAVAQNRTRKVRVASSLNADGRRTWKVIAPDAKVRRREGEAHEEATVYLLDGRPVKVETKLDAPSGDWGQKVAYFFYPDGRTAFRFEEHVTFLYYDPEEPDFRPSGPFVRERRSYFDEGGRMIRDLLSVRKVPGVKRRLKPDALQHEETNWFVSVEQLPFKHLLK